VTRKRETRCLFSTKCIVLTALGLVGMISAAIFQGALSAAGRAFVEQSEIIQGEIKVVRQRIEGWILKRSSTEKSTASSVSHPHLDADQSAEAEPRSR
jgi:hypothetical protein